MAIDRPGRAAAGGSGSQPAVGIPVEVTEPTPDAVEFVRFCYRRSGVVWPELYDEMCAVASRGAFRGLAYDELSRFGISFALTEMPRMAAIAHRVVDEERRARGPMLRSLVTAAG